MSKFALPCVVCEKPLKNTFEESNNQPYCGTEFTTGGHYGSTIIDVIGDPEQMHFAVNICDTCILRALDAGVIQSYSEKKDAEISLSRHPVTDEARAWVLAQNEKEYGSAWGKDEPVDYREQMLAAGWSKENLDKEEA